MIADEQETKSDTWVMLDITHTDNPSKQVSQLQTKIFHLLDKIF